MNNVYDMRGHKTTFKTRPKKPGLGQQLSQDKKASGFGPAAGLLGLGGLGYLAHKILSAGKELMHESSTFEYNDNLRNYLVSEVRRRLNENR